MSSVNNLATLNADTYNSNSNSSLFSSTSDLVKCENIKRNITSIYLASIPLNKLISLSHTGGGELDDLWRIHFASARSQMNEANFSSCNVLKSFYLTRKLLRQVGDEFAHVLNELREVEFSALVDELRPHLTRIRPPEIACVFFDQETLRLHMSRTFFENHVRLVVRLGQMHELFLASKRETLQVLQSLKNDSQIELNVNLSIL